MIPGLTNVPPTLPRYADFIAELRIRCFEGDIESNFGMRVALATDNSIYQRLPEAALFPRHADDLVRIAKLAAEPRFRALKLAPRGGGTGTNGQSLTDGLVVDVSRHMNAILEINPEEGWVRVEAGVVKDQLNSALRPYGLFFAPELSTSNRATVGGMINTDASGQGSCLYGKTRDHVIELTTVLLGGTVWTSATLDDEELEIVKRRPDRVGDVHRVVDEVQAENRALIEARFPKLNRCLTGYDLAHIRAQDGRFDLNSVLCGSEGTLGFIAEAKLRVLPIPKYTALVNLRYASFDAALRDAPVLMGLRAASIETMDSLVLELARGDIVWQEVRQCFPDDAEGPAQGINFIEFVAEDEATLDAQLAGVTELISGNAAGRRGYTIARDEATVKQIWVMRKRAAGLLGNVQGDKRPIPFIEDTAVPPESLADYIAEFRALLDRRGLAYGMFGHVDAGVLHVRPALDMKDPAQAVQIRELTDEIVALTRKYKGLLWGEHGKGIRSEYAPQFFGPLYPALQRIKAAFDPHEQLNPGKVAALSDGGLLRIDGVGTRGEKDRQIPPAVRRGFDEALHCNGNAACYNFDPDDAMCPSWKATGDRRHSPKGRASLLREWLRLMAVAGIDPTAEARRLRATPAWRSLPSRAWNTLAMRRGTPDFSHEVKAAMDGCLACKSCTGQCPVKVDVPSFRAKFLELYYTRYLRPMRHGLLAAVEHMVPYLARFPAPYNTLVSSRLGRALLRRLGMVASPRLPGPDLWRSLAAKGVRVARPDTLGALSAAEHAKSVVLVQDAFTSYFETPLVLDLVTLLQHLGFAVWVAPFRPNGKPMHVHGFLRNFEKAARANAEMLNALAASDVALIGLDPSMTLTYRSEYRQALGPDQAPRVRLVQEWLAEALADRAAPPVAEQLWLLPHCTERTNAGAAMNEWRRVFRTFGLGLAILPSGCCGMAGTYGHEAENRALSERIYALSWGRHVANPAYAGRLVATGYSCRCQAKLVDGTILEHPVQALLRHVSQADVMRGAPQGAAIGLST